MPEDLFWRTMSPARLHALYDAYLGRTPVETRENRPSEGRRSLLEYIRGGE